MNTTAMNPNGDGAADDMDPQIAGDGHYYGEDLAPQSHAFSIADIRAAIWRQRRAIIILTTLAALLGLVITLLMTPRYRASATIQMDAKSLWVVEGQNVEPSIDQRYYDQYANTMIELLSSRKIASDVVDSLDLADKASFYEAMGTEMPEVAGPPAKQATARRNAAIGLLKGNVEMELTPNSNIGTIKFTSESPAMAAQLANGYADAFVLANATRQSDANSYARNLVEEQIATTRQDLADAERSSLAYIRKNRILDTSSEDSGNGTTIEKSLSSANLDATNTEYVNARNRRILAEQRWNSARTGNTLELTEARDNSALQSLITEQAQLRGEIAQLRERYLPDHPEIAEREQRLKSINSEIGNLTSEVRNSIKREYEIAKAQEASLAASRSQLADQALNDQSRRVELGILSRETYALRDRLSSLLSRLGELESASDIGPTNITIVDRALVPDAPFSPNLLKNLALSILIGFAIAAAFAVLREILDDTIYSPEDIERRLGVPLLGLTPYSAEEGDYHDQHSAISEAYASLRSAVDIATGGRVAKTILITSSKPSEGKTTSALMLARNFAHSGRKTLLIDGDLRHPSVHQAFDQSNNPGLLDVLVERTPLAERLLAPSIPNLDVLPAGKATGNPAHLLATDLIPEFLTRLHGIYDVVIIDASPVMGLADAPLLSRWADFTLLIAEAGRAEIGGLRKAIRRLQANHAHIIGSAITKFDEKQAGYGYGYGYEYYRYDASPRKA